MFRSSPSPLLYGTAVHADGILIILWWQPWKVSKARFSHIVLLVTCLQPPSANSYMHSTTVMHADGPFEGNCESAMLLNIKFRLIYILVMVFTSSPSRYNSSTCWQPSSYHPWKVTLEICKGELESRYWRCAHLGFPHRDVLNTTAVHVTMGFPAVTYSTQRQYDRLPSRDAAQHSGSTLDDRLPRPPLKVQLWESSTKARASPCNSSRQTWQNESWYRNYEKEKEREHASDTPMQRWLDNNVGVGGGGGGGTGWYYGGGDRAGGGGG